MSSEASVYIGCAGWARDKDCGDAFPPPGAHLERYARRFNAVEINSSFYRPHRSATYDGWAASAPDGFGFSVKVPRSIIHRALIGKS